MMREKKNIRRFIPVDTYDIPGMETWLEELAEKGLYLDYFAPVFGVFQKGTPRKVRYRLEIAGEDKFLPDLECRQIYEENGWRFVDTFRKQFYVFMTGDESAQEIHTDPIVQSYTLDRVSQQLKVIWLMFGILAAVIIVSTFITIFKGHYVNDILLHYSIYNVLFFLFWLLLGTRLVISAYRIIKLRKRLRSGVPFEHQRKRKHGLIVEIGVYVVCSALLTAFFAGIVQDSKTGWKNMQLLSETEGYVPPVYLADIEQDEGFHYFNDHAQDHYPNTIYYDYSAFVPMQCFVSQSGGVDGRMTEYGYNLYQPQLNVEYYEATFDFFAKPIFAEMVDRKCRWITNNDDYVELESDLLDGAVYSQNDGAQQLVAYRGKKVIAIWYEGEENLAESLEYIGAALA